MQQLTDRSTVPPDGYRYFQPETRTTVQGGDYFDLFVKVKKHRLANNVPLGPLWEAEVEDTLCRLLPPGFCKEAELGKLPVGISARLSWHDLERGAQVFVNWALAGAPTVDQAEADRRGAVCAGCFYNLGELGGCRSCGSAVNLIKRAVGNRKTSADPYLKNCAVCKCSNQIQVWFRTEELQRGVTEEMMRIFPDFCWKKKGIIELHEKTTKP